MVHNRITYVRQEFDGITQEDTYRGDGLNLYVYCQSNSVIYSSADYNDFRRQLQNWADYRFVGGVKNLPGELKRITENLF